MELQVSRAHYFKKKYVDINRFISYFYQIDLVMRYGRDGEASVLEIGVGNGTVSDYLEKAGFRITTCDIDKELRPDYVADVRALPFRDSAFDVVMACEILEHIPFEDFEAALKELCRVSRQVVIVSLPYRSTGFELVVKFPWVRTIFRRLWLDAFLRIPLVFRRAGVSGQHYWEMDLRRYSLPRIRAAMRKHFAIVKEVRPLLNSYHYFFVLKK